MFCGNSDISDFDGDPEQIDQLRDLLAAIENCGKPVIMAIHGMALGGGLELAMAGYYRIAQVGTRLGPQEVTLGIDAWRGAGRSASRV